MPSAPRSKTATGAGSPAPNPTNPHWPAAMLAEPLPRREYLERSLIAVRNKIMEFEHEERLAQRLLAKFHNDSGYCETVKAHLAPVQKKLKEFRVEEELCVDLLAEYAAEVKENAAEVAA